MENNRFITLFIPLVILSAIILWQCDEGLSPPEEQPGISGISGKIFFKNWPPQDSLFDIRLIVFRNYPPQDIVGEIISGSAFVYPDLSDSTRIPFFIDSLIYQMSIPAGTYQYVAVAQQYGSDLFNDWRAVGQYDTAPEDSLPSIINVQEGQLLKNIFIWVNFDSLPPQPF